MNTQYYIKVLGFASILTILICAGIFFYTRWDNQRFVAQLPKAPQFEVSPELMQQRALISRERTEQETPPVSVDFQSLEGQSVTPDVPDIEIGEVLFEEAYIPEDDPAMEYLSLSMVELPEAFPDSPVEGIEFTETKAAWQAYNDFLATHPDYAYERLDEGFREMYGDRPEVDTLVDVIRKANAGALTVDDAIDMVTATLSVMPADQTEVIEGLSAQLEMFEELKKLQADGEDVKVIFNFKIGE